jgi:hypothetical protein
VCTARCKKHKKVQYLMIKIKPEYTQAGTRYVRLYYTYITFQCLHTNYSSRNEQYESIQDSRAALWTTQHLLRHLITFITISTLASASSTVLSLYCFFPFRPPNANGRIYPKFAWVFWSCDVAFVLMAPTDTAHLGFYTHARHVI